MTDHSCGKELHWVTKKAAFKVSMGRLKIPVSVLSVTSMFLLQALAPGLAQVLPSFAANGWLPTTPLPNGLANHSTVIYSDRIHVIGGKDASENPVNTVFCSVIGSGGDIGNWAGATPLPANLFAHTAVVSEERVYVTGGWHGANTSKLTYYALFDSSGLGNWESASATLPTGLDFHSAVAYNGRIYVMGGWDGYRILRTVYFASIEADGDILSWYLTTDLPRPIYAHSSVVYAGRIYVIGGRTVGKEPLDTVYMGTLAGGGVGAWIQTASLPQKLYYQSAFVSNGKIYVMGGCDESSATDKVYSTTIKADGSLEPWEEVESLRLPKKLCRHSVVLAGNGSVYLLGGEYNDLYINDVYFIPPLSLAKSNDPSGPVH
ncbi:MAG: Kelch repeat-containing protein, partial [Promethearchaeota archaeon]